MNFEVFNLSGYEMPKAVEDKNKEYVAYGDDNNYYSFLIESYLQSSTNNAAIRSISDLIYGKGLSIDGQDPKSKEVEAIKAIIGHRCLKKIIQERKMLGQAAMQVIYTKEGNNRKVAKIKHFPIHTLRPEKMDEDGVINAYYYHPDWANKKRSDSLKRIPSFGTSTEAIEIFCLKPYVSGYSYFSPVDYSGSLPYCELENEIADYLLNEAKNSFSGTKVVNFNNGIPDAQQREEVARDVRNKLTGARGQKVIIAFNENKESQTTVEDISLNDAPEHYSYLADEARNKILVGHRVTSPMLLGIKDGSNGLSSNTDEIMVSSQLFNSTVIRTYQDEIIEALEEILEINGAVPELVLLTSQPIEISEEARDQEEDDKGAKKEEDDKGVKKEEDEDKKETEDTNLSANFNPEEQVNWLTYLSKKGEQIDDNEWEMIHAVIDDEETEGEDWEAMLTEQVNLSMPELASAPADNRGAASVQDTKFIKVRYAYVQGSKKNGSSKGKKQRAFCTAMESASRLYRKEDILKMQSDGVNSELGHNKAPYSIWKHKGGVNCHHKFERRIYLKRTKADGTAWGGGAMNGVRKVTVGQAKKLGFDPKRNKFRNDTRVAEAQIDRADKGHHPSYSAPTKKK